MHDTYYIVARFNLVILLTLVSVCLIALLSLVRRHPDARLNRIANLSIRIWAFGLTITLAATLATRLVTNETVLTNLWVFQLINTTMTVGAFLMVMALAATVLVALWSLIARKSE